MNFPLHFLDDQLAVNTGVLLEISQRYVEIIVPFETIPSLVGPRLFEANCPNFSVCGSVVHGRVSTLDS